jgi:hypothetical protein
VIQGQSIMQRVGKVSFYGKTWIFRAQAFMFGFLSLIGLLSGSALLLKWMTPENGKSGTIPGLLLVMTGFFFLMPFSVATFNVIARRKPTVRICSEGLEIRRIGKTALDEIPFIPGFIRFLWTCFSGQAIRVEQFRIAWGQLIQVEIQGVPMMKSIIFTGTFEPGGWGESALHVKDGYATVALADWQFKDTLERVELAVRTFASDHSMQLTLESWTKANS